MSQLRKELESAMGRNKFSIIEYKRGLLHPVSYAVVGVSIDEVVSRIQDVYGEDVEEINLLEVKKVEGFRSPYVYKKGKTKLSYLLDEEESTDCISRRSLGFLLLTSIGYFREGLSLNTRTASKDILAGGRTCCNTSYKYVQKAENLDRLVLNQYTDLYSILSREPLVLGGTYDTE